MRRRVCGACTCTERNATRPDHAISAWPRAVTTIEGRRRRKPSPSARAEIEYRSAAIEAGSSVGLALLAEAETDGCADRTAKTANLSVRDIHRIRQAIHAAAAMPRATSNGSSPSGSPDETNS